MAIRCPRCGTQHDVVKFEGNQKLKCRCGFLLDLSFIETVDDFLRFFENEEEREKAAEIQRDAQVICQMILNEECSKVDIDIAEEQLKEKVRQLFPHQLHTYEIIYEARFKRLWEQFRAGGQESDS